MKYNYLLLLLLAVMGVSCSQSEVILTEDELPEDIFYLKDDIKPFTGKCYIYFSGTEQLKEQFTFKAGVLNGERISYHRSGEIKRIGNYDMGNTDGTWKAFDENGAQVLEVEYESDSLSGDYIAWYETGVIREKGFYHQNTPKGLWVSYDEAGMIIKKSNR